MATVHTSFDYASATVPPGALFIAADEPLLVYPSVAAAERHLEALDVRGGVYVAAYGPNGEPYRISSDGNRVIIRLTGGIDRPDELRGALMRYLEEVGRNRDTTAPLGELVTMVWEIERDFWQEHDPYGERFGTRGSLWGCAGFMGLVAGVLYLLFR